MRATMHTRIPKPQDPTSSRTFFASLRLGASLVLGVWCLVLPQRACAQGSLTPPGTPAPTMKSLDQIASTGIAINATNTPGDPSNEAVISAAGNDYLTGNLH